METQLGLTAGRRLLDSAIARATELGVPVSIAVVDAGGHVVIKARMDGAPLISVRMAEDKAYTSAATNLPTSDLHPLVQPGEPLYELIAAEAGRVITFGGGSPLRSQDEQVTGGVGVSGGTVEQDAEIAGTAARAWMGA
jgi:corrinoid adenosyltransferase